MSGFSDYTAQAVINYTLLGVAMPNIANRYLALFTGDPKDDNSGSSLEVAGAWYQRQQVNSWTAPLSNVDGVSGTVSKNSSQITFPANSGSPVTVTHWAIYDASSGGSLLYSGALATSRTLQLNDVAAWGPNQLEMTFL